MICKAMKQVSEVLKCLILFIQFNVKITVQYVSALRVVNAISRAKF